MNLKLNKSQVQHLKSEIKITGSKSESNRLLVLKALNPCISIDNLSNSDDTKLLQKALFNFKTSTDIEQRSLNENKASTSKIIDIHHAGTAMRFLTAYFTTKPNTHVILTGSKRMKNRPIGILVEALRQLGGDILYKEKEGYPPLEIKGKQIIKQIVTLKANVSSQYISALLLIASKLPKGLAINLEGKKTSVPYIKMTISLLNQIGVSTSFEGNIITIKPQTSYSKPKTLIVESDWSSASYWYSIVALSKIGTEITLSSYKKESLQGDAILVEIYKQFGVVTKFKQSQIILLKSSTVNQLSKINFDLTNAPDIAQTIAVTAFGLGMECHLTGLHTLKIKETDRLVALKNEIEKFGAKVQITDTSIHLSTHNIFQSHTVGITLKEIERNVDTYNDHRMAMAFAPLALKTNIIINNAEVVSKSYPSFWEDLKSVGINIEKH